MAHTVRFTENFTVNLDAIRDYLDAQALLHTQERGRHFDELMEHLFDRVIPNLEQFPQIGRDFLNEAPSSDEGRALLARVRKRAKSTEVREYIIAEYLILYAVRKTTVFLLSIRHHQQLSFDLKGHWT